MDHLRNTLCRKEDTSRKTWRKLKHISANWHRWHVGIVPYLGDNGNPISRVFLKNNETTDATHATRWFIEDTMKSVTLSTKTFWI